MVSTCICVCVCGERARLNENNEHRNLDPVHNPISFLLSHRSMPISFSYSPIFVSLVFFFCHSQWICYFGFLAANTNERMNVKTKNENNCNATGPVQLESSNGKFLTAVERFIMFLFKIDEFYSSLFENKLFGNFKLNCIQNSRFLIYWIVEYIRNRQCIWSNWQRIIS